MALVLGLAVVMVAENDEPIAPKLSGLGDYHYDVTTSSEDAQGFFDQGRRRASRGEAKSRSMPRKRRLPGCPSTWLPKSEISNGFSSRPCSAGPFRTLVGTADDDAAGRGHALRDRDVTLTSSRF